jgi:hypothetical protein
MLRLREKFVLNLVIPISSVSGAKHNFWLEERAEKSRPSHADVEFSICCQKGFVDLPLLKKPPALQSTPKFMHQV